MKAAIALGLPVSPIDDRSYDFGFLGTCAKPKLFVSGDRDQFANSGAIERARWFGSRAEEAGADRGGRSFF